MRKSWATVVLQRTKQRIGIDLIAWADQITAAIIAAEIVSMRCDRAAVVENVLSLGAGLEDRVRDLNYPTVVCAAARPGRVPANCAVSKLAPGGGDAATDLASGVAADRAVHDHNAQIARDSAATIFGRVATDSAVDDDYTAIIGKDAAAFVGC